MPALLPWAAVPVREALDLDLHFTSCHCQRHPFLTTNCQTSLDRFLNVVLCLFLGFALANASRYGRAFGDEYAIFVLKHRNEKFHLGLFRQFFRMSTLSRLCQ